MKNDETNVLKEKIKMQDETIDALAHQVLVATLKAHPDLKRCPNYEFLARLIAKDYNYGPNAETGALQAHHDKERRFPSGRQLQEIVGSMLENPESAHLFRPAGPKWEAPRENPWLKESFNLTRQCEVAKNDPELAAKWEAESKRREHALRRASNL
jgi:hypothetical protein